MNDARSDTDVADLPVVADTSETLPAETAPDDVPQDGTRKRRRRPDRGLLIASFVIACGLLLIIVGFATARTGDDGIDRPDEIESLSPVENAIQVLQQESIVVDLEFGHEAVLIVDGVELETTRIGEIEVDPGEQINLPPTAVFDAGNSVISFQPTEGAQIERLEEGLHRVTVRFWKVEDGPDTARSYTWTFNVI